MLVAITRFSPRSDAPAVRQYWEGRIVELEDQLAAIDDEQESRIVNAVDVMRRLKISVVISEEQGEVNKFRQWDWNYADRKLLKEGFSNVDGKRISVEDAFKKERHPFRVAIVCAMWLTGFDVPSLATMYLDKPLKAAPTLMQAIAREPRQ